MPRFWERYGHARQSRTAFTQGRLQQTAAAWHPTQKLMSASDTCEQSVSEGKTQTEATGRCRKERAYTIY